MWLSIKILMKYYISFVAGLRDHLQTHESGSRSPALVCSGRSGVASMTCAGTSSSQAAAPINHHNTRLNVMDFSNLGANKTN